MSEISVMHDLEEDHDLRTILALYDSSDLLAKMEEGVRVLAEMIPSGFVEQEELLDDALAVVCGDLCQIMELGIKDPSLVSLLTFLRTLDHSSSTCDSIDSAQHNSSTIDGSSLPHPAVDPAKRELLYAAVINVFKDVHSRQKFLTFLDDDSSLADLYLSFAPLRNPADCVRLSRALCSLPQVDDDDGEKTTTTTTLEPDKTAISPSLSALTSAGIPGTMLSEAAGLESSNASVVGGQEVTMAVLPDIIVNSPEKIVVTPSAPAAAQPPISPVVRTKPILHTRSRSNLDHIPSDTQRGGGGLPSRRRLSFSRGSAPSSSVPEPREIHSYFSPPRPGQSLIGYLQSQDTVTCADLERENAHFFVSDVIIAAVEQMQYERRNGKRRWNTAETNNGGGEVARVNSDEDVASRLSSGRMESPASLDALRMARGLMTSYQGMVSDGQTSSSTGTTSGSLEEEDDDTVSFRLMQSNDAVSPSTFPPDNVPPTEHQQRHRSPTFWRGPGHEQPSNSAEAVAVSLLRKFSEHHLPKASELDWLVSESDVPQQTLLPLPKSTFISPDSPHQPEQQGRIRGNLEWAPLRPQIIYNVQPHVTLKVGIASQKNRCAGCGGKMDAYQQARMRFCDYTGKYFCVCCHEFKTSIIPARVLLKWDFTKYYVSNFAADFIARIFRDPLFDVSDCNMELYRKSKSLALTLLLRRQLVLAAEYVRTCRQGQLAMAEVEQLPTFVWQQIHTYSLDLFCSVKDGVLPTFIKPVAELAVNHVVSCGFCCSKGFICEFCRDTTPLFPFQTNTVHQCSKCFSCFHTNCIKKKPCPKCARLQARRSTSPLVASSGDSATIA